MPRAAAPGVGDISFDFTDADIRGIVAEVLGSVLRVNYTIDPAVRGTATLRTTTPITRAQVLPALNAALAQVSAAVTESGGFYQIVPAAAAVGGAGLTGGVNVAGGQVIPLRYASAEELAKLLQPYAGQGGKIIADTGRNTVIVSGDPTTREALVGLVAAFDVNLLAGQSYALLPITSGGAKDFATAMTDALRAAGGAALSGNVRVIPMDRINAVLIISREPRYIDEVRRIYALVERNRRQTLRGWSVYYLQSGRSNDVANVLQQAFTPGRVTAVPTASGRGSTAPGRGAQQSGFQGSSRSGGTGGAGLIAGGSGGSGFGGGGGNTLSAPGSGGGGQTDPSQNPANPLLGGLDPTGTDTANAPGGGGGARDPNAIRIIPNPQNNALLIYATAQERDTIESMLRKIDILPLQVRIDATIAEVTLNDTLSYGTQFFFRAGGLNGALNFSAAGTAASALASGFPGFVLSGLNNGNAALSALQAVTTVKVLSSPQVLVLDNEAARLQVGSSVPYLTSSSQSTLANSSVINSVEYRDTGVIMEVTPRVNSGGQVTLDISQEVSDVDTTATSNSNIQSPTFLERKVTSRVVVQDGQTVGLAGLIRDNSTRGNSGIPWLKDVPLLGFLAGQQQNQRARTELLVLITPRVVHDQRDARALTEDLRDELINAAVLPQEMGRASLSGSPDPQRRIRRGLSLER